MDINTKQSKIKKYAIIYLRAKELRLFKCFKSGFNS